MTHRRAALLAIVFTAIPIVIAAGPQQPETAASLLGRVVDARTRQPLKGVKVRITGPTLRAPRSVETDAQGQNEIATLPPGYFSVTATRFGYVEMTAGQREP